MADVTEVIHKISYEVNDEALINATKAIQAQIVELGKLTSKLNDYQRQMTLLSKNEVAELDELSRKIDTINTKVKISASKLEGIFKQVGDGILKGLGVKGKVDNAIEGFVGELVSKFSKLKKFDFKNLAGLAGSLLSFNNVAPLAISFLTTVATKLLSTSSAADTARTSYKKFLEGLKKELDISLKTIDQQVNETKVLLGTLDANVDINNKKGAAEKLKSQYASLYKDFTVDQIAAGGTKAVNEQLLKQIEYREKSNYHLSIMLQYQEKLRESQKRLNQASAAKDKAQSSFNYFLNNKSKVSEGNDAASIIHSLQANLDDAKKLYNAYVKIVNDTENRIKNAQGKALEYANLSPDLSFPYIEQPKIKPDDGGGNIQLPSTPKAEPKPKPVKITLDIKHDEEQLKQDIDSYVDSIVQPLKAKLEDKLADIATQELSALQDIEDRYARGSLLFEDYEAEKTRVSREYVIKRLEAEISSIDAILTNYEEGSDQYVKLVKDRQVKVLEASKLKNEGKTADDIAKATQKAADEEKIKKQTDEHNAKVQQTIDSYQELASAAVDAYKLISKAQQEALDKEIEIREKRVADAKKLAERGNADVLRIEEQRLEEAQKKKEQIAQREQQVNSALALSNSLVAVTSAIATATKSGDPYTVALRVAAAVAAVIAALGSGQNFVRSFDTSTDSFADGVVGYKGKGGPRDDSNWVRISNGESVITAAGTSKHRSLLEAINNGQAFTMAGNGLPFIMPAFQSPEGVVSRGSISNSNMRSVERKLDNVVAAIEDNRLRQNIFFNEQGVGLMTERAIKKNNRRFK